MAGSWDLPREPRRSEANPHQVRTDCAQEPGEDLLLRANPGMPTGCFSSRAMRPACFCSIAVALLWHGKGESEHNRR